MLLCFAARDQRIAIAQSLVERRSRSRPYPDIPLAAAQDGVDRDQRSTECRKIASRFSTSSGPRPGKIMQDRRDFWATIRHFLPRSQAYTYSGVRDGKPTYGGSTATYLSISGPAPGLSSSVCGLVRRLVVRSGPHERRWRGPAPSCSCSRGCMTFMRQTDSAPLPSCARGQEVMSV